MSTQENAQLPAKKPVPQKGGLLTALCIALVVVGIGVIAYPFVLIAIEEYNKNEVVARLEREFPIFRADEDFEMLDEAALAAMPVVAVPQWTTEEVASANALLDGTSAELLGDLPIDLPFTPVTMPPIASPTAAPHTGVPLVAHGDMAAVEFGQNLASLPDPPMDGNPALLAQAALTDERVLGASEVDAQGNPVALQPAQGSASATQSQAGSAIQPGAQTGASASQSQAGSATQPGTQAGASAPQSQAGSATQPGAQAGANAPQSQAGSQAQPGAQASANAPQSQSGPGAQTGTQADAGASQAQAGLDGQSIAQAGAAATQSQAGSETQAAAQARAGSVQPPASPAVQPTAQADASAAQSGVQAGGTQGQQPAAAALEGALSASNDGPPNPASPGATDAALPTAFENQGPLGPTIDPRIAFQLRDAAPVYYEDFARIVEEANDLAAGLATFTPYTEERRQVDSPTELTVASINSQVRAVSTLLNIFQTLPSTSGAVAPFSSAEDPAVVYNVALRDGVQYLAADLAALDQVVNQFARVKRFPRARDQIQHGFDRSVELVDQTLNLLDYMAQQLDERDTDAYLRSRSACMVGETEAVYLLELPALKLKIGCFPNVNFEQMYSAMRKGVALYPRVGTPNTNTNISMISHRAGSAPFFQDLDKLKPGDTVLLHTRGLGSYRYLVERVFVVEEDDWTPMHTLGYPALTLVSCEEFRGVIYGRRIMVHCKLVGIAR